MINTYAKQSTEISLLIIEEYTKKGRKTIKLNELQSELYEAFRKIDTIKTVNKTPCSNPAPGKIKQNTLNDFYYDRGNFKYNLNYQERDNLISEDTALCQDSFGMLKFYGLSIECLQKLINLKFADPKEKQNNAPSIARMLDFGNEITKKYNGISVCYHGYAIPPERPDYRVSIEVIEVHIYDDFNNELYQELVNDFKKFTKSADEKKINTDCFYAWWD